MTLHDYATPRQKEYLEAIEKHGSGRAAAKALGVDKSTIHKSMKALKAKAAMQGYAPEHNMLQTVPEPFTIKRISHLGDADGNTKQQWTISEPNRVKMFALAKAAVESLTQEIEGLAPNVETPKDVSSNLLNLVPVGDPHFGMHSYAAETGANYDLKIAERLHCDATSRLVSSAPFAEHGVFANMGDAFHSQNDKNRTEVHGHVLDGDSRISKVMKVTMRAMCFCVLKMLEKNERVTVYNLRGNHDPDLSVMLSIAMDAYFRNEERVTVDCEPTYFKYLSHGKNLVGLTHGHGVKAADMPLMMATDVPKLWSAADYRVIFQGHVHHQSVKEFPGAVVESVRTLSATDAHHTLAGYRSARDLMNVVYEKNHGEIQRIRCGLSQLEALVA